MSDAGNRLALYGMLGASLPSADQTLPLAGTLAEVREFANDLIRHEAEHAEGSDTPIRLAIANDLLAILDGDA